MFGSNAETLLVRTTVPPLFATAATVMGKISNPTRSVVTRGHISMESLLSLRGVTLFELRRSWKAVKKIRRIAKPRLQRKKNRLQNVHARPQAQQHAI